MVPMPRGGTGTAKPITHKLDPDAAWPRVDAVLKGDKKDLAHLPLLVTFLSYEQKELLWGDRYDDVLKLGGDHVLDVALGLGLPAQGAIDWAMKSKPRISANKLRAYLRSLPNTELADVENIADLRTVLTGKMLEEVPHAIQVIDEVATNGPLIHWLYETTSIELVATIFASHGSAKLARTLDSEQLWGWLDHVQAGAAFGTMHQLMDGTGDPVIKDRLKTMLGPMAGDDGDAMEKVRDAGQVDLHSALDDEKIDRAKLMDLAARAGSRGKSESYPRIVRLIRRAKLSADDVVTVLLAFEIDVAHGLPTLLDTEGSTKSHVLAFLAGRYDLIDSLKKDKVRNAIRGKLGKSIGLRDILRQFWGPEQQAVLQDEALRSWYLTDATPEDMLTLCGADADRAARACRLVKADRGMDWVYKLSPAADKPSLRIVATHCGDPKLAAFIRDALLAEKASSTPVTIGATPEDPAVFGGEADRLGDAERVHDQDAVLARLADMNDEERTALAADHRGVQRVLHEAGRDNRLRALELLELPFAPAVAYATPDSGFDRQLVVHLRSRPVAEEVAALADKVTIERALLHVHPDPLQTFPSLHDPKVLARTIELCPLVVERLLAGSESSRALALLGHPDVRKKFEMILEARPDLIDLLPRYEHLDGKAQNKVDKVAGDVKQGGEAAGSLGEVQDGTYDGDQRRDTEAALQDTVRQKAKTSLADAVKLLANEGGDTDGAMALIRQHHDEIVNMLDDGTQWPVIEKLAQLVDLPPDQVFNVGLDRLLMMKNARRWFFQVTPGFVLLHELRSAKVPALAAVASDINNESRGAVEWLERLPVGAGLTDREDMLLDTIQVPLTNGAPLQALFKTRFGITPPALDAAGIKRTYATLSRLPNAHVQQERIKEIKLEHFKGNEDGVWTGSEIKIVEGLEPGAGDTTMSPQSGLMTRDQLRTAYGWDDAKIDALLKDGRLEEKLDGPQPMFKLPEASVDKFTQVLLHEIGHSVDSILGTRTEVIYDIAGWRKYDEADFDRWAEEMGGWDKIKSKEDKDKIRQAWLDALRSQRSLESMVNPEHPARSKKYEGVGIVDGIRNGKTGMYTGPIEANGRAFLMQPYYGFFYSLNYDAAMTAPSSYSLYAPQEYFAECYVEYYRQVQGTPADAQLKGGMLPAQVKKWFDTHVDKVRFDPKRLQKPDTDS